MNKYLVQTENIEIKTWISSNLSNYLKTNDENQGEIEHIIDFLNNRASLYADNNRSFKLKKMSYSEAVSLAEKWVKSLQKKGNDMVETEEDTILVKQLENGFRIVKLKSKDSFAREGRLMSHCVLSYFGKTGTNVYSLRDEKNSPHCTIEVLEKGSQIQQIKGKGNSSIHPNYIKMVVEFLKVIGMNVRSSEMSNLGYDEVDNNFLSFLRDKVGEVKTVTYNNTVYLYRNQVFPVSNSLR